jgi:hypothetical protein
MNLYKMFCIRYLKNFLLLSLLFITILFTWYNYLKSGLFIDEAGSYWAATGTLSSTTYKSLSVHGQSPFYYILLNCWCHIFGFNEWGMRSLSIILGLLSLFVIFNICIKFYSLSNNLQIKNQAYNLSWLVIFLLVTMKNFVFIGFFARPYSLVIFFFVASFFYFQEWILTEKPIKLLLATLFLTLTFYSHYLFLTLVGILILWLILSKSKPRSWLLYLLLAMLLLIISILPGAYQLHYLAKRIPQLTIILKTTNLSTLILILLDPIVVATFLFLIVNYLSNLFFNNYKINLNEINLIIKDRILFISFIFFIFPPTIIYLVSLFLNTSLLLPRYYLFSIVGLAIFITTLLSLVKSPFKRFTFLVFLIVVQSTVLITTFNSEIYWNNDINFVKKINEKIDCNIFALVGFIESKKLSTLNFYYTYNFVASPLDFYGLKGFKLIPAELSRSEKKAWINQNLKNYIHNKRCQILVSWKDLLKVNDEKSTVKIIYSFLSKYGYKSKILKDDNLLIYGFFQK